jgi:hypothetical protein
MTDGLKHLPFQVESNPGQQRVCAIPMTPLVFLRASSRLVSRPAAAGRQQCRNAVKLPAEKEELVNEWPGCKANSPPAKEGSERSERGGFYFDQIIRGD